MEISVINQLYTLIYSLILGFFLGAIYDIIRIFRIFLGINYVNRFTEKLSLKKLKFIKNPMSKKNEKSEKYKKVVLFITDILYFFTITPIFVVFLYYQNQGIVRWYAIFGAVLGFVVYYFSMGKLIISISEYIVFVIKIFFSYVVFLISRPFIPIIKFSKNKLSQIRIKVRNNIEISKKEKERRKRKTKALIHYGKR